MGDRAVLLVRGERALEIKLREAGKRHVSHLLFSKTPWKKARNRLSCEVQLGYSAAFPIIPHRSRPGRIPMVRVPLQRHSRPKALREAHLLRPFDRNYLLLAAYFMLAGISCGCIVASRKSSCS